MGIWLIVKDKSLEEGGVFKGFGRCNFASSAESAHAHAHVVQMVVNAQEEDVHTGSTVVVFTSVRTGLHDVVFVLPALSAGLPVLHEDAAAGVVRHNVLVVGDSPVVGGPVARHELGELLVTDSGRAEVVHRNLVASFLEVHARENGHGSAEAVASHFDCCGRVDALESGNFSEDVADDGLLSVVEA